jgi:molybdopterin molybdotransferase
MPEFLKLLPPSEALSRLLAALPEAGTASEKLPALSALGRVTAEDLRAPHPLPEFPRATVDGFAVRAADTYGASESIPAYLTLVGEVPMGAAPTVDIQPGQAALIHTGGMLPQGADAVVMLEQTQAARPGEIEVGRPAAEGENVILVGEDVAAGQVVLPAGVRLRPAEIGGAMALGIPEFRVAIKPRVGILSSGDEVIPPDRRPGPGQVRDVNSYALAALVSEAGGEPLLYGILPDRLDLMLPAARKALEECDLVVITAGSSASARDMTSEAIASLGSPGVLVHGVNVRPGKPTILAVCEGKAVIGLPGNPVSALVIAGLFVVPVIEKCLGLKMRRPRPSVEAILLTNVASQAGREDWVAVQLRPGEKGWEAEPIFAKSNLIFSLVKADGLICIPPETTGFAAGETVTIFFT